VQVAEKRTGDWPALAELIATLGGEPHPTAESERAVYAVATSSADSNVSAAALLALGSMAGNLRTVDAKRSAAIIGELTSLLSMAASDDQREHALEALGNSASESSLSIFLKYAKSETPGVRAAAMDGLRNIRASQADVTLLQSLGTDPDKQVRLEAAFALGFRKPSAESFSTQRQALKKEEDDKVRAAILGNLAKMASKFPESRKVIENSAANDPSEYVRKTATGLLNAELGESSAHK
jgi:HEAT repeat protein